MSKFLSIIVPSNRPVGFQKLWDSLIRNTANIQDIEVIKLVDSYLNGVTSDPILKIVEQIPTIPLNMSELNTICYEHSTGQWIMLANDDCEMQTPGWDVLLRKAVSLYPDEVALFYPNDGMFGDKLACFPIISRKVIEATKLLPMKYRRYKQDDTIFGMFPANRRVYLENIRFQHFNNKATEGFHLPEGGIYPIDKAAAEYDNRIWFSENTRRQELALKIRELIGIQAEPEARVVIAVPTAEFARQAAFYDFLNLLEKPLGTAMIMTHGQSPAKGRNLMIEQALAGDYTHILFIDDDTMFPSDMLVKLLSHNKDIVTALYLHRNYPHLPLIFDYNKPDGSAVVYHPKDEDKGLKRIVNAGLGACLINTRVFRGMEPPWITLGENSKDQWDDDISFFQRVEKAGFEMYVDLDCCVGHMATVIVRPSKINGKWYVNYNTGGSGEVSFELVRPTKEQAEHARTV